MVNLKIKFCKVEFDNPIILPSGIAQDIPNDHENAIRAGAGGVTTKSLTVEPREGYPIPRIIKYEYGILNAVGIRNPGIKKGKELLRQFINKHDLPIIVSVFATNGKDFETLVEEISQINPQFIELNLSCPHLTSEFGLPIGSGPEAAVIAVMSAKKHANKIPVIAKLTPNIPDIASIAKACEYAGADAICAINTVGSGMVIDVNKKKPVLGNKRGGVSGPGIKPVAVRCVYDIYEAVKIPIIGMGGITTWQDTVEMIMAGANLVGVGSAVYTKGYKVYSEIKEGLSQFLEENKASKLKDIIGIAH